MIRRANPSDVDEDGSPPKLERDAVGPLVGSRLRALRRICAAVLASVGLLAAASVAMARAHLVSPLPAAASTELSLTLTAVAAVLILVTSRLQAATLGRAARRLPPASPAGAGGAPASMPGAGARAVENGKGAGRGKGETFGGAR